MGPERRKGELPADEAAEAGRAARREEEGSRPAREATGTAPIDEREDEGYDQPESSAQKRPRRPEDEMMGE